MTEDNVESLKKSFDLYGPLHPIIIDKNTNELVTGHSRDKTGRPWTRKYVVFKDKLEVALVQAAENLHRRELDYNEKQLLLKNIQFHKYENDGTFFTQQELSDLVHKSVSWVAEYWSSDWTHDNAAKVKSDDTGGGRKTQTLNVYEEKQELYENFNEKDATMKLIELKRSGDDNQLDGDFNKLLKKVSPKSVLAYSQGKSDAEIMKGVEDKVVVVDDVAVRREFRERICREVIDEFKGHAIDFTDILYNEYRVFFDELGDIFNS